MVLCVLNIYNDVKLLDSVLWQCTHIVYGKYSYTVMITQCMPPKDTYNLRAELYVVFLDTELA